MANPAQPGVAVLHAASRSYIELPLEAGPRTL
jgi:hypothetical protein